jgi:hypothetical protein
MEPWRLTDTPPANGCQARATTDPGGVPEGSRGSSAATTPGPRPPQRLHPEGGARYRGSPGPAWTILPDRPADRRVRPCP